MKNYSVKRQFSDGLKLMIENILDEQQPNKECQRHISGFIDKIIDEIKIDNCAIDANNDISNDTNSKAPDEKIALVFGNEAEGVEQETLMQCEGCIEIPQFGMKHSLNISVAAGVVLWEMARKGILNQ